MQLGYNSVKRPVRVKSPWPPVYNSLVLSSRAILCLISFAFPNAVSSPFYIAFKCTQQLHSRGDSQEDVFSAMAVSKRVTGALGICMLVVMTMVADSSAAGGCNPNALYPCLSAIQGAHPPAPTRPCCNAVRSADKNCMCNQLKSSSFPAQMVQNGLQLPKKCGRTDLRGFKCGRYTFPY